MGIFLKNKYEYLFISWLILLIGLLIIMIIVGGLTRLTESGLSITQWDLFSGIIPPLDENDWEEAFSLYREIPQYKLLKNNIEISEFKIIYYWEYFHRLLGRFIGLFFLIPFVYFIFKKIINKKYIIKLFAIFCLILLQGLVGWYMVQSGLVNDVTVSHYRLSIHLLIAFIILSSILWVFLNHKNNTNKNFFKNNTFVLIKFFLFFLFLQIILGAFVSGLDAGKIYQTWPLMGESYFPNDLALMDYFNFNEHSFVQFIHRNVAYLIFLNYVFIGFFIYKDKLVYLYKKYMIVFFIILLQMLLGILTLTSGLNIYLASLHQISSIFLLIFSISLYHHSIS